MGVSDVYIFEDNKKSLLAKLFSYAYSEDLLSNFMYSEGVDNIISKIDNAPKDDRLFIFMDAVPDNKSIKRSYYRITGYLRRLGKLNFVVFPIVCAEYYFIRSVYNIGVLDKDESIECCINRLHYRDTKVMSESINGYVRSFENFCKLILRSSLVKQCIKVNIDDHKYYFEDCKCGNCGSNCKGLSLYDKSMLYIQEYPCFPFDKEFGFAKLSDEEIYSIHKNLVDEYNSLADRLHVEGNQKNRCYEMVI